MEKNPLRIQGNWREGWSLDVHVVRSEFLGYDGLGHPQFDTFRSELGELLYQLKYKDNQSALEPIVEAIGEFLIQDWCVDIDVIVPVPPSKQRHLQPVFQIADELGSLLGWPVDKISVQRRGTATQIKNVEGSQRREVLAAELSVEHNAFQGRRVLLIDDLYQSGATMNAVSRLLQESGRAAEVMTLALTRTRN